MIGAAVAGAASFFLAFGENSSVQLRITSVRRTDWPDLVIVATGGRRRLVRLSRRRATTKDALGRRLGVLTVVLA